MPTPTVCTVSGTITNPSGVGISGVVIRATQIIPYIHPTDNSMVMPYEVTYTTGIDGTWSLSLVETATPVVSITITFSYPTGSNGEINRISYPVIIPNTASATFASLLT